IVLVSHSESLALGLKQLLDEVAHDVVITTAGSTFDGRVGTSYEKVQEAVDNNPFSELLVFYDLGSAKMNIDVVLETTAKKLHVMDCAMVEGAYVAAAMLGGEQSLDAVINELKPLMIKEAFN
ncbi:MAG: PTS-dependent dihydroxyacetone kinase phosphotransferase subunit DhaM, partial [Erysipelotrichales bacterium]